MFFELCFPTKVGGVATQYHRPTKQIRIQKSSKCKSRQKNVVKSVDTSYNVMYNMDS